MEDGAKSMSVVHLPSWWLGIKDEKWNPDIYECLKQTNCAFYLLLPVNFFAWRHLLCVRFNFKLLGNSHSWSGYIYGNDFFLRVSIPKLAIPTHLLPLLSHGRETNATFLCVGIFPLGVLNLRFKASTKPWDCHHAHVLEIAKLYAYFLCFLYVEVAMRLFILPAFFPFYLASKRRLNKYKKRTPKVVVALCLCIK